MTTQLNAPNHEYVLEMTNEQFLPRTQIFVLNPGFDELIS